MNALNALLKRFQRKGAFDTVGLVIEENQLILAQMGTGSSPQIRYVQETFDVKDAGGKENMLIADAIKKAMVEHNIKKGPVNLSVNGFGSCLRVFTIPVIPNDEIPQAVRGVAKKYVAHPLNQMTCGYAVQGEVLEQDVKKLQVVFAAYFQKDFDRHSDIIKKAGLKINRVLPSCFSVWNNVKDSGEVAEKSIAVIHVGQTNSEISIFKEKKLIFTRNVPVAHQGFMQSVKEACFGDKELNDEQTAELVKVMELTYAADADSHKYKGVDPVRLKEGFSAYLAKLIRELELSFSHYRQISRGAQVDKLLFSGLLANVPGADKAISEILNIPSGIVGPPAKILKKNTGAEDRDFEDNYHLYAEVAGALIEEGTSPDLLLDITSVDQSQAKIRLSPAQKKILAGFGALVIIWYFFVSVPSLFASYQLVHYKRKISALGQAKKNLIELRQQIDAAMGRKEAFVRLQGHQHSIVRMLLDITTCVDADRISITDLSYGRSKEAAGEIAMNGHVIQSGDEDTADTLVVFVDRLKALKYFGLIKPKITGRSEPGALEQSLDFEIACAIKDEIF